MVLLVAGELGKDLAVQHTRFKVDQAASFASLDAADAYPRSLTEGEQLGFWYKPYDWSEGHVNFLDNMYQLLNAIETMRLKPQATIMEVGSGEGWTTEILATLGYKVICLEPAEVMLNAARQRVADALRLRRMPHLIHNVSYHTKTLEEADFLADYCADGMLFFESFNHIIDENKSVGEAFRLLKPTDCPCILGVSNWQPGNREQERFWLELPTHEPAPVTPPPTIAAPTQSSPVMDFALAINRQFPALRPVLKLVSRISGVRPPQSPPAPCLPLAWFQLAAA